MHDPLWMRAFLAVHITAGAGAFLLAPLAMTSAVTATTVMHQK